VVPGFVTRYPASSCLELVEEELRRIVADGDEDAADRLSHVSPVNRVAQPPDLAVAGSVVDRRVRDELDLLVRACAIQHDRRRRNSSRRCTTVTLVKARQIHGLLHRGVAAADHDQLLVLEERAVTRGACRHAAAHQTLPAGDAQPAALAPVAMIAVRARYSVSSTQTRKGRSEKSTATRRR
jgi:hypothetical protein